MRKLIVHVLATKHVSFQASMGMEMTIIVLLMYTYMDSHSKCPTLCQDARLSVTDQLANTWEGDFLVDIGEDVQLTWHLDCRCSTSHKRESSLTELVS